MFHEADLGRAWRKRVFVTIFSLVAWGPMIPSGAAQTLYGSLVGNITDPERGRSPGRQSKGGQFGYWIRPRSPNR